MTVTKKVLLIAGICVALGVAVWVCLIVAFIVDMEKGEKHQRQIREEQRSGKWDFGDQPALFAVAHAIVTNDQDAIRAAAKALPDDVALLRGDGIVATPGISRVGQNFAFARRGPELHQRPPEFLRDVSRG